MSNGNLPGAVLLFIMVGGTTIEAFYRDKESALDALSGFNAVRDGASIEAIRVATVQDDFGGTFSMAVQTCLFAGVSEPMSYNIMRNVFKTMLNRASEKAIARIDSGPEEVL